MSLANFSLEELEAFEVGPNNSINDSATMAATRIPSTSGIGTTNKTKAPVSPRSPQLPAYEPISFEFEQRSPLSPTRSLVSSDNGSFVGRNQSHSVNGVHMHVQENAKVPLLNRAVDRSNSSRPSYPPSLPISSSSEEAGSSMAELFLSKESKYRQSLNLNYESQGALMDDTNGTAVSRRFSADGSIPTDGAITTAEEDAQMEFDALTEAIDPTPWSEIERKMHDAQVDVAARPVESAHTPSPATSPAPFSSHPHQYSYYPYGRQYPLPIPERIPSPQQRQSHLSPAPTGALAPTGNPPPPQGPAMAQALATAAALASVGGPKSTNGRRPPASPPQPTISTPTKQGPRVPQPYTQAQQPTPNMNNTSRKNGGSRARHYHRQRATYTPPEHSSAHASSRASVLAAASQKSRYGFGDHHSVPSVPAPPPIASSRKPTTITTRLPNSSLSIRSRSKTVPPKPPVPPPMPAIPNLPNLHHGNNAGAAYERKKQRAKDARVKLNESIERLSIAMSLAGSQSKQRMNLLHSRISKTEQRNKSLQIHDECVKLAEQAKKWDRPSFVGTAASLVQALNSQCESLTRELICLQERLDAATGTTSCVPGSIPSLSMNGDSMTSHPDHKRTNHPTEIANGTGNKRVRGDDSVLVNDPTHSTVTISDDQRIVFGNVAKMLDPVSLTRCPCVSKSWHEMKAFDNDDIWLQLAVKRFGFYNVRQWTEKIDDGDNDGSSTSVPKKTLYRAMNAANVMPHFPQEGLALLGDAKITGRISGWVFMVERSNGETLRSVKREPGSAGPGSGSYQSRPVVELRVLIQNTGMSNNSIIMKNQQISVDTSTRRSAGELKEIDWDDRFEKTVKNLDGSKHRGASGQSRFDIQGELCRLRLFDAAIIEVHINAKGCSTTSRFQQRSNFTKLLVSLEGTTVPMVIPFLRDGSHGGH